MTMALHDSRQAAFCHLSHNAYRVLESRYLRRDDAGLLESPEQLFRRVASGVAQAETNWGSFSDAQFWEERFYEILSSLRFLPNSPTLMNMGLSSGQLSACFVLPVEDSLENIFSTLRLAALIQQSGGGTGFNFSRLRAKCTILRGTQGTTSGPLSFLKIFDSTTGQIKEGGKRRGANIGILNVDHPDIEEFIESKSDGQLLNNFNISIGITDAFMHAVIQDNYWELVHPHNQAVARKVRARKLWDSIVRYAWQCGDPGLIFLDTINRFNPTPGLGKIESTNPCGEVPLLPFESCNLGSLNLPSFVLPAAKSFDWDSLEEAIQTAVRFLDNAIEVNRYFSPDILNASVGNRKIGLGVMGWAEALSFLEIPYDSQRAIELAEQLMEFISEKSKAASIGLAEKRGVFKNWANSIYYPHTPIRNATRTAIAPTGSISIIADTSSSIEPFFALAYQRLHVLEDETLTELNKSLLSYLHNHHIESQEIVNAIAKTGTLRSAPSLSGKEKRIFKTALEITPDWHLRHQVAFQKFTDNAVSKTINLPEEATPENVSGIYEKAWRLELKGITVFRNQSKSKETMRQGLVNDSRSCKVCKT